MKQNSTVEVGGTMQKLGMRILGQTVGVQIPALSSMDSRDFKKSLNFF